MEIHGGWKRPLTAMRSDYAGMSSDKPNSKEGVKREEKVEKRKRKAISHHKNSKNNVMQA